MITGLFTADIHDSPEFHPMVKPAMDYFVEQVRERKPDFVGMLGDFFVKRGFYKPTETYYMRTVVTEIAKVCPVVIMPGNHDETHSGDEVDSLTGAFLYGDGNNPHHNVWVVTKPTVINLHLDLDKPGIQLMVVPYPSRQLWMPGKDLDIEEAHREMTRLVGETIRGLSAKLDPGIPSAFLFHGSVEGGQAGPEVTMTTEMETVVRQTDLPSAATLCIGGHLHLPQTVGRFIYTGAPCSHTWGTERLRPSFVEARFAKLGIYPRKNDALYYEDDETGSPGWWGVNPNDGHQISSNWSVHYKRHDIPVAIPKLTIDKRQEPSDNPQAAALQHIEDQAADIPGADIRLRLTVGAAQRESVDKAALEVALMAAGANSAKVLIETRADTVIRSDHVHAEMKSEDLLKMWVDFNPTYGPYLEELQTAAKAIDAELTPEQRVALEPVDYRWVRIWWDNWKQWGKGNVLDLTKLKGLTAIVGENKAGKSNLAELLPAIAYGAVRADLRDRQGRGKIIRAIREGEDVCKLGGEFVARGSSWRIERTIQRTRNAAKGSLVLSEWGGTQWVPRSGNDARETQRKIESLLGTITNFLNTGFCSQFDLDRVYSMSQAELQETIQDACNTKVFEWREAAAKLRLDATRVAASLAGKRVEDLEAQAKTLHEAEVAVATAKQTAENLNTELGQAVIARDAAEEDARKIVSESERLTELDTASKNAHQEWVERTGQWQRQKENSLKGKELYRKAQAMLREAQEATSAIPDLEAAVEALIAVEAEKVAIMDLKEKYDACTRTANEHRTRAADAKTARLDKKAEALAVRHGIAIEIQTLGTQLVKATGDWTRLKDTHQANIREAEKRAGLLDEIEDCIPPNYTPVENPPRPMLNESCPLLQDAITERDRVGLLKAMTEAVESTPPEITTTEMELAEAREKLTKHDEASEHLDREGYAETGALGLAGEATAAGAMVGYDPEKHANIDRTLGLRMAGKPRERLAATQAAQKAEEARKRELQGMWELRLSGLTERRRDLRTLMRAQEAAESAREALDRAGADVGPRVKKAQEAIFAARQVADAKSIELADATRALGKAEGLLETAGKAAEDLSGARTFLEGTNRKVTVLEAIRSAFSRQGIPYMILEQALPLLRDEANRYLEGTENRIDIVSEVDPDTQRAKIEITFQDETGIHDRTEASGYDTSIMSMAIRWALAKVAADFTGTTVRQFTQDEGFGAFHKANLLIAQRMVRDMADRTENFFVISHVDEVLQSAESVLEVHRDPGRGSFLTGPGAGPREGTDEYFVLQGSSSPGVSEPEMTLFEEPR